MTGKVGHRGVSRDQWLGAALEKLAEGNVSEISVTGLAREFGISKAGFYWHFKDREDMLRQLLAYWTHEITEVIINNPHVLDLGPKDRLQKTAEMIVDHELTRYEIGIRQWAMKDKGAAKAVRFVNRKRLDYTRRIFHELGFSGDDAEVRAMLFVCYHSCESPVFAEIPRKRRRALISKRIDLLTTPPKAVK